MQKSSLSDYGEGDSSAFETNSRRKQGLAWRWRTLHMTAAAAVGNFSVYCSYCTKANFSSPLRILHSSTTLLCCPQQNEPLNSKVHWDWKWFQFRNVSTPSWIDTTEICKCTSSSSSSFQIQFWPISWRTQKWGHKLFCWFFLSKLSFLFFSLAFFHAEYFLFTKKWFESLMGHFIGKWTM